MKKILSLTLAVLLLVSMIPTTMAADTNPASQGTTITAVGTKGASYEVTVPATLNPGQTGNVTATGTWAADKTLKVTAPNYVDLVNGSDTIPVSITFDGISEDGNDNGDEETATAPVTVGTVDTSAFFGTWTGTLTYTVELVTNSTASSVSGSILRMDDVSTASHVVNVNLSSDTITDFSTVNVMRTGKNIIDINDFTKNARATDIVYDTTTNSVSFTKNDVAETESYLSATMWLPAGTYTASADNMAIDGESNEVGSFVVRDVATKVNVLGTQCNLNSAPTFTITEAQEYEIMLMMPWSFGNNATVSFTNFQLELGTEKTSFEPYTEQVVKANADGSVTGLTSVSPTMTIYTDSDVTITCEYQKKN